MTYLPGCISRTTYRHAQIPSPSARGGLVVWFTGLSGAGKTTLARAVGIGLEQLGIPHTLLDADELRKTVCADLGYTRADRMENARRIVHLAREVMEQGEVALVAAISPYGESREHARAVLGEFVEVYVNASIVTCMARDPKGLYQRVLHGELRHFTGVHDPYEPPEFPDLECCTDTEPMEESCAAIVRLILRKRNCGLSLRCGVEQHRMKANRRMSPAKVALTKE